MAKVRKGLGRGLESLLGGGMESGLSQNGVEEDIEKESKSRNETNKVSSQPDNGREEHAENKGRARSSTAQEENVEGESAQTTLDEKKASTGSWARLAQGDDLEQNQIGREYEVDIDLVQPNPDQPRTNFKKEELEELAQSIKKNGLLQPILVRPVNGTYQIIAGERRWQACKSLHMKKVPIRVKEADDEQTIILALIENIQRSNLNPIEEAYGYKRMIESGHMTQSEVAQAVSKGRTTITNALRLLELPEEAQQLLFEEKISAGHARAILSIPTREGRSKLTEKLIEEKLSVRDAERIARLLSGKGKGKTSEDKPRAPKTYRVVARALSETLGSEVKIKSSQGKNRIEVSFKDEADLERLYRLIAKTE